MDENIKLKITKVNNKINYNNNFIEDKINENLYLYKKPKFITFNEILMNIKSKLIYIIFYILFILFIIYSCFY